MNRSNLNSLLLLKPPEKFPPHIQQQHQTEYKSVIASFLASTAW